MTCTLPRRVREVFSTAYSLKKSTHGARYFALQSGVEKIIANIVISDHGMRDTVAQVTGPWDVESEGERGAVPIIWNLDSGLMEGFCLPMISKLS